MNNNSETTPQSNLSRYSPNSNINNSYQPPNQNTPPAEQYINYNSNQVYQTSQQNLSSAIANPPNPNPFLSYSIGATQPQPSLSTSYPPYSQMNNSSSSQQNLPQIQQF